MKTKSESQQARDQIWWLTLSPLIWTFHFLASYLTVAIYCAKHDVDADVTLLRWSEFGYTLLALILIFAVGYTSYRRHRMGDSALPHDFDSREDQQRFLGFAAFLLSILSGVATLFTAVVFVFLGTCH
jgi:hypothetical protein